MATPCPYTNNFDLNLLKLLPNRWFGAMSDFTLLAIPFFVFTET